MKDRFGQLRAMGIRTVMITGDNPLTATVDRGGGRRRRLPRRGDARGQDGAHQGGAGGRPARRHDRRRHQRRTGAGPGRRRRRDEHRARPRPRRPANMVDLDSDPTKLIDIVAIGKQLLITRGALTTFSIANDVAKYFAIIPAMFVVLFPGLDALNIMGLATPRSAIALGGHLQRAHHRRADPAVAARSAVPADSAAPPCCDATCSSTASAASSRRSSASSSSTSSSATLPRNRCEAETMNDLVTQSPAGLRGACWSSPCCSGSSTPPRSCGRRPGRRPVTRPTAPWSPTAARSSARASSARRRRPEQWFQPRPSAVRRVATTRCRRTAPTSARRLPS